MISETMNSDTRHAPCVLVVEDDYTLLEIVAILFRKAGLVVQVASSGEAALTLLRDRGAEIDWLFTDIGLPGFVDGWSVADEYRRIHPERPIVYASRGAKRPRRTVPGSIFVEKPFQPAEILRIADMMRFAALSVEGSPEDRGGLREAS